MNIHLPSQLPSGFLTEASGDIDTFRQLTARATTAEDVPLAADIQQNIPVYDGQFVNRSAEQPDKRRALLSEWTDVLAHGAGIIVIKDGLAKPDVIDRASQIFEAIIDTEQAASGGGGDHFAKAGANDRVWNALEKHCLADPQNFAAYYASHGIAMAAEAWLGPSYQMTAQVNRVNPGGAAQSPHRDYHLGFMLAEQAAAWPAHVHSLSPYLTLQGAVAHCDMPLKSGPTQLLPFSQSFTEGYLAFSRPEFQDHFARNFVQIPLNKGDLLFFSPAVMHAAGTNKSSDIYRLANLLQISSAFGRAMETVDRQAMSLALYPALLEARQTASLSAVELDNVIASCAEGYAFPTSLDRDPPVGGLAPKTQAQFVKDALIDGQTAEQLRTTLQALHSRQHG